MNFMPFTLAAAPDLVPAAPPPAPPEQSIWQTLIMLAIGIAFVYLILLRPEKKRRRALEQQRSALKKGDRVTAVGIIGTIVQIQEHTVILRMYDGSKIEVLKGAINEVLTPSKDEEKEEQAKEDK